MLEVRVPLCSANVPTDGVVPRVTYDSHGIGRNSATLAGICAGFGVEIAGVTKATAGNPDIARLMLSSGISVLAESRLLNIRRLRDDGITVPIMLIRAPSFAEIRDAAKLADIYLLSEIETIRALAMACNGFGKIAEIIVMVDLGDMREGVAPADLCNLIDQIEAVENACVIGIGTNLACNIGILPDDENMGELARLARQTEAQIGRSLRYVSAGNSSAIPFLLEGKMPFEINHLRLGESILLGRETAYGERIVGTKHDCFTVCAQIIEIWPRYLVDGGPRGLNALGHKATIGKRGLRQLAVLNLGAVDVEIGGLTPKVTRCEIVGFSSDHMIMDVTDANDICVGAEFEFSMNYHALTTAMTSPYLVQVVGKAVAPNSEKNGSVICPK